MKSKTVFEKRYVLKSYKMSDGTWDVFRLHGTGYHFNFSGPLKAITVIKNVGWTVLLD